MGNFTPQLSSRLDQIVPSATVAISQRANELRAEGVDVLSFSVGQPDFEPPRHILDAAKAAVDKGVSKYTAARGVVELRRAICAESLARRGHEHQPSEVVVSVGAKHSLFNVALALFNPGDEVVVPAPYWVSYPEQVRLAGANPVIVPPAPEDGFRLTPQTLEKALSPKTKALILCSPSNPTGAAYSADELAAIGKLALDRGFWIITDEIYGRLVYGGFEQRSLLTVLPELRDRLVVVDGVSKTYAMTGWRIGWILAPEALAKACDTIQGQSTTNPAAIAQQAALAALTGPQDEVEAMRQAFEERRSVIVNGLNAIDGIECAMPVGAFYAFPDVTKLIGKSANGTVLADDLAFARYLLDEARCAVVPGSAFGAPGYLRVSYAASNDDLREGLRRMGDAIAKLS
ncbi:MAG: pyridoxal phosphate-dependent aminotransferase [Myxococcota bacterium]